jgi:hypothetical protein
VSSFVKPKSGSVKPASTHPRPSLLSIYSGRECCGFLLRHGRDGTEAFTAAEVSLGIFPTDASAADAVTAAHARILDAEEGQR